ncbi:hypothetical protein DFJ73DRAFT_818279 [Zopfochytrium polystomum]|nr:hypothetical protein DFJ73DRAFT_818279 [Zopfochytrium polystomum]
MAPSPLDGVEDPSSSPPAFAIFVGPAAVYDSKGNVVSTSTGKLLYGNGQLDSNIISSKLGLGVPVSQGNSDSSTASGTSNAVASAGLSGGALAGLSVLGVAVLCVLGLVAFRSNPNLLRSISGARRRAGGNGFTSSHHQTKGGIGGVPVWEMGQWRVIRAEDWATLEAAGIATTAFASNPDQDSDISNKTEYSPVVGAEQDRSKNDAIYSRSLKKNVSFSDQMDVVIPQHVEQRQGDKTGAVAIVPSQPSGLITMRDEESGTPATEEVEEEFEDGGEVVGADVEEVDDDGDSRTISFRYSLLSQLSDHSAADIHRA